METDERIVGIIRGEQRKYPEQVWPWGMEPEDIIENHLEEIEGICDSEFAGPDDSDIFHVIDRVADINPESRRFYCEVGNLCLTMPEVMEAVDRLFPGKTNLPGFRPTNAQSFGKRCSMAS